MPVVKVVIADEKTAPKKTIPLYGGRATIKLYGRRETP